MFLVGVYGFIFTSFVVSIVLLKLQRKKMFEAAETFYKYAEWMVSIDCRFNMKIRMSKKDNIFYTLRKSFLHRGKGLTPKKMFEQRERFNTREIMV